MLTTRAHVWVLDPDNVCSSPARFPPDMYVLFPSVGPDYLAHFWGGIRTFSRFGAVSRLGPPCARACASLTFVSFQVVKLHNDKMLLVKFPHVHANSIQNFRQVRVSSTLHPGQRLAMLNKCNLCQSQRLSLKKQCLPESVSPTSITMFASL